MNYTSLKQIAKSIEEILSYHKLVFDAPKTVTLIFENKNADNKLQPTKQNTHEQRYIIAVL